MRVVIASNFVRNMPWSPAWWSVALSRGFVARGREVCVVVDGMELVEWPVPGVECRVARSDRVHLGAHPGQFARLVSVTASEQHGSVVLSLTPLIAGDLWLPVEPSPGAVAARLVRDLKPVSLALELAHHPWLPIEAWYAAWAKGRRGVTRLSFDGTGGSSVPRVSLLSASDVAAARAFPLRSILRLSGDRTVAVASLPEVDRGSVAALLGILGASGVAMDLIVMTRRPHTVATLAAGMTGTALRVVPMNLTRSLPGILAGCDLAVAAPERMRGASWAGHAGRFVADAIALGVPVVAHPSAAGSALLPEAALFRDAASFRAAADAARSGLARVDPSAVSLDRLLDRLESIAAAKV
jgi:hypothetical protein